MEISIADLRSASDLAAINDLITQAMLERTIQSLIRDDGLEQVSGLIIQRSHQEDQPLLAAAMLARLAAVARQERARVVLERAGELFLHEPPSLATLADSDGKAKNYAAHMLAYVDAPWVQEYRYREAVRIDTADASRRELLLANLAHEDSVARWLAALARQAAELDAIGSDDTRLKRVRRLFGAMREVMAHWDGEVGKDVGPQLAQCLRTFLPGNLSAVDETTLLETVDHLVAILVRIVEIRFSSAFDGATHDVLIIGKQVLGYRLWGQFVAQSTILGRMRIVLLETALVLARQMRTDEQIMAALSTVYRSKSQLTSDIKRHFRDARELDANISGWWCRAGESAGGSGSLEQRIGNTEDQQIGALLIEVEDNREAMEKVGHSVVGYLEISEPVLASTVKKAVDGYKEIAQIARRLARMRRLSRTDLKDARLEYNPIEHEMLGGHTGGVRWVRVVRDGIQKEFNGKIKTLVKPWVEPEAN